MTPKAALLYCLKVVGIFALCRMLTRRRLRILCYHGMSVDDLHDYNPMLFMRPATFERRMTLLKKLRYPVVSLEEGIARLKEGRIHAGETVITIDDGWQSTKTMAAPILKRHDLPATVYVTTYYCEKETEVFNVALKYVLWRSDARYVTIEGVHPKVDGTYRFEEDFRAVADAIIQRAEVHLDASSRQQLLEHVAQALQACPFQALLDGRFKLMTRTEVGELSEAGLDVQMHTHRHRMPMADYQGVVREINENRDRLEEWTGKAPHHFCYPSGQYGANHPAWLTELGVQSSTTCEPGLNDDQTDRHRLRRFLDSEDFPDIVFEAELAGVGELLRALKRIVAPMRTARP
ncbi:MAG: polysaccharide deacetylase family protein [Steroidobacteraceae bacterium]|jgi:peptidoglycan/xylan/chitin deacetylase (PgdA/CDA1 family)|nr:polysaccharide deacetylase family protein [Steroidobacteraceae bacterium]